MEANFSNVDKGAKVLVRYLKVDVDLELYKADQTAPVIEAVYMAHGNPSDRIAFLKAVGKGDIPDLVVNEMDIVEAIKSPLTSIEPDTYQFIMGYTNSLEEVVEEKADGVSVRDVCEVFTQSEYLDFLNLRRYILRSQADSDFSKRSEEFTNASISYVEQPLGGRFILPVGGTL